MRGLGVPYSDEQVKTAVTLLDKQSDEVAARLIQQGVASSPELPKKEIVALIAYLQRLGTDIKAGAK